MPFVAWGRRMALSDHVADREWGKAPPRPSAESPCVGDVPSFLLARPRSVRPGNDNERLRFDQEPAHELECLRHVLAPDLLRRADDRARALGVGADRILIQQGTIDEIAYLGHLSDHTGIAIDDLSDAGRDDLLLGDDQIAHAAACGIAPLRRNGRLVVVTAPRNLSARGLCRAVAGDPTLASRMRLTSDATLRRFLQQQCQAVLVRDVTHGLGDRYPTLSAAPCAAADGAWRGRLKRGFAVAAIALLPPFTIPEIWSGVLALWFLGFVALRLASAFWPRGPTHRPPPAPDGALPAYTIIAALYREARSVAPLLQAIDALDYPREKLDVILVVEPDDLPTHAAIARLRRQPHVRMLTAPAVAPQTKPKALNWALPFVRGSFVAVFDAEDRPDPGQLRAALDAFRSHDDDVACAQASLCIDNETHSWLSRTFAAEYAGHFDIVLPGLSAMRLPLPLGGSSNHFRTDVLREVGGWDAYNVTEDADLGIRLARFGYRSVTFASTTFEEAPLQFGHWLRQRSRWMKGWLQTWCVHMRHPLQLWRDAGTAGFFALNMIAGGNVLTALAYPVMLGGFAWHLTAGTWSWPRPDWLALMYLAAFLSGCGSTIVVGVMGLARRGRLRDGWILAMTPLYWGCMSLAAWHAVLQYIWRPYHWDKTEHGVVRRIGLAKALRCFAPRDRRLHR
jgi:glycosyltransferase XagB